MSLITTRPDLIREATRRALEVGPESSNSVASSGEACACPRVDRCLRCKLPTRGEHHGGKTQETSLASSPFGPIAAPDELLELLARQRAPSVGRHATPRAAPGRTR